MLTGPHDVLPIAPFRVAYSHQDFDMAQHLACNLSAQRRDSAFGYSPTAMDIATAAVRSAQR